MNNEIIVDAGELTCGVWKYVITRSGDVRFTRIDSGFQHRHLIQPSEVAAHAGNFILVDRKSWLMGDPDSESLGIHGDKVVDKLLLTDILGSPPTR